MDKRLWPKVSEPSANVAPKAEKNEETSIQERLDMNTQINDMQWEGIARLLPPGKNIGRPRADDRKALTGILYVLKHGCRWQDVPPEYGSPVTAWRRFKVWRETGAWEQIWESLLREFVEKERQEWIEAFLHGAFVPVKKREKNIV